MALQLPSSLLAQVANFGQQPMQNLQQGLLTPVQMAAQPGGVGAITAGIGGMLGLDMRTPEQKEQQMLKGVDLNNPADLTKLSEYYKAQGDVASAYKYSQRAATLKQAQAKAAKEQKDAETKSLSEQGLVNLTRAYQSNATPTELQAIEDNLLKLGVKSTEIESARDAGRQARTESETLLVNDLRRQVYEAINSDDNEALSRIAKTAKDSAPGFDVSKEVVAAQKLRSEMIQYTTEEANGTFNKDLHKTIEEQLGVAAANAYASEPDNAKWWEEIRKESKASMKAEEEAGAKQADASLIKDNTVFNDVINGATRAAIGEADLSDKQREKVERAINDGFDGLYSQAKNKLTIDQVNSVASAILSDPQIDAIIKEGKTKVDRPGLGTGDDQLRDLINKRVQAILQSAKAPETPQPEDDRAKALQARLKSLREGK